MSNSSGSSSQSWNSELNSPRQANKRTVARVAHNPEDIEVEKGLSPAQEEAQVRLQFLAQQTITQAKSDPTRHHQDKAEESVHTTPKSPLRPFKKKNGEEGPFTDLESGQSQETTCEQNIVVSEINPDPSRDIRHLIQSANLEAMPRRTYEELRTTINNAFHQLDMLLNGELFDPNNSNREQSVEDEVAKLRRQIEAIKEMVRISYRNLQLARQQIDSRHQR